MRYIEMLKYKRPAFSATEEAYIKKYIAPVCNHKDDFGNYIKKIGNNPEILFSSHTDTVHSSEGMQKIYCKNDKLTSRSNCLGADDTTGNYIMLEMIAAAIPGLYIFHRDEECGGRGSAYIAENTPELLDNIEIAIAFDRLGYNDIVTEQRGYSCCSPDFAAQFSTLDMRPACGSFTDTANYTDLISECTNISVGYFNQHTKKEYQDIAFLSALTKKLLLFKWESLTAHRDLQAVNSYNYIDDLYNDDLYNFILDHPDIVAEYLKLYSETPATITRAMRGEYTNDAIY